MTWYKIVLNNIIVAVGTTYDLRRVQEKHQILVVSDENHAQYIQSEETLYHDQWFAPVTSNKYPYVNALIYVISEEEYNELKEEIDAGNEPAQPDDPTPEPEPESEEMPDEPSPRTRLKELEEQVAMLTECLLEVSEIIYGGE